MNFWEYLLPWNKRYQKPKHEVQVYHRIKGDIIGEFGNFFFESYVQTHKSSKMEAQPRFRERGGDKQDKFATKTTNTRTTRNIRERVPVKATRIGRRNEGTSAKTETKYESRTTNLG